MKPLLLLGAGLTLIVACADVQNPISPQRTIAPSVAAATKGEKCNPNRGSCTLRILPVVDGYVRDSAPEDSVPDAVFTNALVLAGHNQWTDERGILEFKIANVRPNFETAILRLTVNAINGPYFGSAGGIPLEAYVYSGDGAVSLSDFAVGTLAAPMFRYSNETAGSIISFDITSALTALRAAHAVYAGINLRVFEWSYSPDGNLFKFNSLELPPAASLEITYP